MIFLLQQDVMAKESGLREDASSCARRPWEAEEVHILLEICKTGEGSDWLCRASGSPQLA